jgi:hypothetical protein
LNGSAISAASAVKRMSDPVHIPIEGELDLHAFAPRDIAGVVADYVDAAAEAGLREVRLVHGRGRGVQRGIVQAALDALPIARRMRWGAGVAQFVQAVGRGPQVPWRVESWGKAVSAGMQKLAQKGNGNAAYIDTIKEARKVLVERGLNADFLNLLYARIIPNLKRIGLLTDRIRPKFEEMGVMDFENLATDGDIDWRELEKPLEYDQTA